MSKIESYKDLNVWQKAHELVLKVYEITKDFPPSEHFGLTSQLRRSIISVPANITEGNSRVHLKEYYNF